MKPVAIIMGSQSDLNVMQGAVDMLTDLNIPFKVQIVSAHRTPDLMYTFAQSAHEHYSCIIAGAGGAAHLPGMVAALTLLPVIGVPVAVTELKGQDALYSIVQMPKGVPVATVAINNSANAALLAARIMALQDKDITSALELYRKSQADMVKNQNKG